MTLDLSIYWIVISLLSGREGGQDVTVHTDVQDMLHRTCEYRHWSKFCKFRFYSDFHSFGSAQVKVNLLKRVFLNLHKHINLYIVGVYHMLVLKKKYFNSIRSPNTFFSTVLQMTYDEIQAWAPFAVVGSDTRNGFFPSNMAHDEAQLFR